MLDVSTEGPVLRLTLDRPEVRNALSPELLSALARALTRAETDPSVRAVVLTGNGAAFSAGADLSSMRRIREADSRENSAEAREMGSLFHRVARFPKPVIARANGPAVGGGVGLMAACDVVVASDQAWFAFSEVRLGIVPAVISPFCIRRLGPANARRLFLTGERIDASEARRLGLVDVTVPAEELDEAVAGVVADVVRGGPKALAHAKELVDRVTELGLDEALDYTADLIARLRASEEASIGINAFLEKSAPSWVPGRRGKG